MNFQSNVFQAMELGRGQATRGCRAKVVTVALKVADDLLLSSISRMAQSWEGYKNNFVP